MPEGDTVWFAANRMRNALAGKKLVHSDFRVPRYATADLSGRTVLDVVPYGKHLLTRFSGGITLHTHFKMDGTWQLVPATGPKPRRRAGPAWQIRAILKTEDWTANGYRLPVVELGKTEDEDRWVGHLGPDVLGPDWNLDIAVANLRKQPEREIGDALIDQRNLAGPGNIYRSEALFLQGISPWSPVSDVDDLPALVNRVRDLMLTVIAGPEYLQSTTGSSRAGEQHWVIFRAGQPCHRCGTRIREAMQGEPTRQRITAWCPHCQPGPDAPPGSAPDRTPRVRTREARPRRTARP